MLPEPIIVKQSFQNSIQDVWNALTVLEEMKIWYFPMLEAFETTVGFSTEFLIQVEDRKFQHQWKILEVIPLEKISYQWKMGRYPGVAISTFEFLSNEQGTTLILTSEVIEPFPQEIPEFRRESGVQGWNFLLKENLVKYLEEK